MSTWDEKAEDYAVAHHTYEHLGYGENMRFHKKFAAGAKWQRDQLRTDEAVDLVARGICRRNWPKDSDFEYYWRRYGDDFRADARAAITELLGEGQ